MANKKQRMSKQTFQDPVFKKSSVHFSAQKHQNTNRIVVSALANVATQKPSKQAVRLAALFSRFYFLFCS